MSAIPRILKSGKVSIWGLNEERRKIICDALTTSNPKYWQLLRGGHKRAIMGMKKEFRYYRVGDTGELIVPRGTFQRVKTYLSKIHGTVETEEDVVERLLPGGLFSSFPEPRDYQKRLWDRLKIEETEGIIHLPTGYGKTIIACEIVRRMDLTALIIVPKDALLIQFVDTLKTTYGVKDVGIIKGAKREVLPLTVASAETLSRNPELVRSVSDCFSVVIADEAHTMITEKRMRIFEELRPKHLFGMTATPRRTDGQGAAVFHLFGPAIVSEEMERTRPTVTLVPYGGHIMVDEYTLMVNEQIADERRNFLIADTVNQEIAKGRKVLVLTKRIEHSRLIGNLLKGKTVSLDSNGTASENREKLQALRRADARFEVLLGTYSMLSTGVDIPTLDTLVFAGDLKSDVLVTQCVGRILRIFEGKQDPKIFDIQDVNNFIFMKQARERMKFYRNEGWVSSSPRPGLGDGVSSMKPSFIEV